MYRHRATDPNAPKQQTPSGALLQEFYRQTYPDGLAQRVAIERDTMWKMVDVFTGDHPEIRRVPWYKILIEKIKAHV
jgi:hypothetical protein